TRSCAPNPGVANGYADELRFEREQVAIGHTGRFATGTLESSLMRNTTETTGRTIPGEEGVAYEGFPSIIGGAPRKLETTNTVLDSKFIMPLGNHMTTVGLQWWDAELDDGLANETFEQTTWSLFAEDEWMLRDDLALTLGGRYDHHDAFGSQFSPRSY
ncbi:MAG TPA: TonB-dependent receptor, partial [Halomonas sp.]|nr:TonB-dependent receptor [Halomonas sp.]